MRLNHLALVPILAGALMSCAAYGQGPGYGPPPGTQPSYDDRGYDDRRYDDRRYDDRGYDDRRYDDRYSPRVDVGFFYDELSPYGDWVYSSDHGWAWFPRNMHPQWRPYTDGRWVITEYGWTWASYEPFGWATYHYGRWAWDPRFGWLWVPGTVWGPAWVSWQHGGGYLGWAPLPPAVTFEIGIGLRLGGFNLSVGIRPDAYIFVPERSFLEPRLSGYYVPAARNVTIIHNTTNITNYTYIDNRVVNRGVEVSRIEQVTGRRLQRLHVAEGREKTRTEVAANEVRIYRPEKQKLDSVRAGSRSRVDPPRPERREESQERTRPTQTRRDAPEVVVAPRVVRTPQVDARKIEKQERDAQKELQRYQAQEKQKLDKLHAQENARAKAKADREKVEKAHRDERAALQQQQRAAEKQLEARLKAQRDAAQARPPARATKQDQQKAVSPQDKGSKSKAQVQQEEKKAKAQVQQKEEKAKKQKEEKAEKQKAAKKQGKKDKSDPPPPA